MMSPVKLGELAKIDALKSSRYGTIAKKVTLRFTLKMKVKVVDDFTDASIMFLFDIHADNYVSKLSYCALIAKGKFQNIDRENEEQIHNLAIVKLP